MPRTYTRLLYHLVFSTKNRQPFLSSELTAELYPLIRMLVRDKGGAVLAAGGIEDHVHLLLSLRAQPSLAFVVQALKGCTSHWLNQERRLPVTFAWQEGYGAFTVSPSGLDRVKRYIERQQEHHRRYSFDDEMLTLLTLHGVAGRGVQTPR